MININDQDKVRLARSGANKLFKVDFSVRKEMSDEQLIELFDQAWKGGLEGMLMNADVVSSEEVNRRLLDKYQSFIDPVQEHRSFRYSKAEFISQLQLSEGGDYQLTQLWRVASSDTYPKTLFITFDSVEEREDFTSLAQSLDMKDEGLGLRLLRNFMNLHPEHTYNHGSDIPD